MSAHVSLRPQSRRCGAGSQIGDAPPPVDEDTAAVAIAGGKRSRRRHTLEGTPCSRSFLLGLPHNAALLAAAEGYGCIPPEIDKLIRQA
jgi:hypothetical protein